MNTKRNGTIDLLKFAFTVMVMLYHTGYCFKGGYIAVDFFFIVSGFLMAKSMKKSINNGVAIGTDTVNFILQKAKGIFPFYISAWLITFIATVSIKGIGFCDSFTTFLRSFYNITMTEMFGNYDMGHRVQATWYISAMLIAMFVIFPIRKRFTNGFDKIIAPLIFFTFIGMAYQSGSGVSAFTVGYKSNLFMYNGVIRGLAEISLGCICYNISNKIKTYDYTNIGATALSIVEWLGFGLVFYYASVKTATDIDLVLLPVLALSIAIAFSGKSISDKLFTANVFSVLGTFSLQIYLTHEFVKNLIIPYIRDTFNLELSINDNAFKYICVYVLLTLVASFMCYFVGKLFINLTNKLLPKIKSKIIKS